jgi:Cu2+-exporting ATPase
VADVQHWFGYRAPSFPGSNLIAPILGTIVFVYGGLVFIRGAWTELADHRPGMMTLISLAITVAFGTSLAATFGLFEIEVWWELASLITIMVLGHWLEMRAISQARGALNALAALLPDTAERVSGAETQRFLCLSCRWAMLSLSGQEPVSRRMEQSSRGTPMLTSR